MLGGATALSPPPPPPPSQSVIGMGRINLLSSINHLVQSMLWAMNGVDESELGVQFQQGGRVVNKKYQNFFRMDALTKNILEILKSYLEAIEDLQRLERKKRCSKLLSESLINQIFSHVNRYQGLRKGRTTKPERERNGSGNLIL